MYRLSLPFALIVNDMPLGQLQSVITVSYTHLTLPTMVRV